MNTAQNGKGSKNRLKGDSLKAYKESKLWDSIDAKMKAKGQETIARLDNCTGDPDEAHVLVFEQDEMNIKFDLNSKSNYAKYKKEADK